MKYATITFKRSELIYDVANYSFVEGDIIDLDNENARHQIFDIAQEGNVDRVTRVINLAYSECVEMLYPYTKVELCQDQEVLDDVLINTEVYSIALTLPDTFSLTTVNLLEHLIHEYLVYRVMSDWMSIVNPSSSANWEDKTENIKHKIKTSIVSRIGRLKRRMSVF